MLRNGWPLARNVLFGIALTMGLASSLSATPTTANFDGYFRGVKVGTMQYASREQGSQYSVSGRLKTSGLVGFFASYNIDAQAIGRISGGNYRTSRYNETAVINGDTDRKQISYSGNRPRIDNTTVRRRSHHVSPGQAAGTVDPITAIHMVLQDRPENEICRFDTRLYSGEIIARVRATGKSGSGDEIRCNAVYSRQAGYSQRELEDGRDFRFTLTYRPNGSGIYEVARMDLSIIGGRLAFIRR